MDENTKYLAESIAKWKRFAKASGLPDVLSDKEWADYYRENKPGVSFNIHINPEVIANYTYTENTRHAVNGYNEHTNNNSSGFPLINLLSITGAIGLLKKQKYNFIEDDENYQKIKQKLMSEWLEKNNAKDLSGQAGLDYLYGSLEKNEQSRLEAETEKRFREGKDIIDKEKNGEKKLKKLEERKRIVERYDKQKSEREKRAYKNPDDDPLVYNLQRKILLEAYARYEYKNQELKKQNIKEQANFDDVYKEVENKRFDSFILEHPEKAKEYNNDKYKKNNKLIKNALKRQEEKRQEKEKLINEINEEISKIKDKEIRYTQKTHSQPAEISPEKAGEHLENIYRRHEEAEKTYGIVNSKREKLASSISKDSLPTVTQSNLIDPKTGQPFVIEHIKKPAEKKEQEEEKEQSISQNQIRRILQEESRPPQQGSGKSINRINRRFLNSSRNFVNRFNNFASRTNNFRSLGNVIKPGNFFPKFGGQAGGRMGGALLRQGGGALMRTAAPLLMNPYVLGAILIAVIIIITIMIILKQGENNEEPKPTEIPGLKINKVGPGSVANGENIIYRITVSYSGSGDIIISDPIPQKTSFVSATGNYKNESNTIKWSLKENNTTGTTQDPLKTYSFALTLRPQENDIEIKNKVYANMTGGGENPGSNDFNTLMTGQGRNIDVLGAEDNFTRQIINNGIAYGLSSKENYIRRIYRTAVSKNVNPLAVMATWGTEAGFGLNNLEFGCDPHNRKYPGFDNQLSCGVNTWNNWMDFFDRNKNPSGTLEIPSKIGKTCIYSDPFLYAAEKYGPVCSIYDSNDFFHRNFVKYYKTFLGLL